MACWKAGMLQTVCTMEDVMYLSYATTLQLDTLVVALVRQPWPEAR